MRATRSSTPRYSTRSAASILDGQGVVTIIDDDGAARAGATADLGADPLDAAVARAWFDTAWALWQRDHGGPGRAMPNLVIADLPLDLLGYTSIDGATVTIDIDAAGWGWASLGGSSADSIDLLAVLLHEIDHVAGLDHGDGDGLVAPGYRHPISMTAISMTANDIALISSDPVWPVQHTLRTDQQATGAALATALAGLVSRTTWRPADVAMAAIAHVDLPALRASASHDLMSPRLDRLPTSGTPASPSGLLLLLVALAMAGCAWRPRRRSH